LGNQSEFSFGYSNPEHAVVEISDKNKSLRITNPEHAVVEISDKNKCLEFKNSEHAVVELSDYPKINNINIILNMTVDGSTRSGRIENLQ